MGTQMQNILIICLLPVALGFQLTEAEESSDEKAEEISFWLQHFSKPEGVAVQSVGANGDVTLKVAGHGLTGDVEAELAKVLKLQVKLVAIVGEVEEESSAPDEE